jgi:hypothetical protein
LAGSHLSFSGSVLNLDKLIPPSIPLEKAVNSLKLCSDIAQESIKIQVLNDRNIDYLLLHSILAP